MQIAQRLGEEKAPKPKPKPEGTGGRPGAVKCPVFFFFLINHVLKGIGVTAEMLFACFFLFFKCLLRIVSFFALVSKGNRCHC